MIAMIFLRVPVAIALGVGCAVGDAALNGWTQSLLVGRVPFTFASAYDLSVVPLFVLMGVIAAHSGMARELFRSINIMFRPARHARHRHGRRLRGPRGDLRLLGGDGGDHEPRRHPGNAPRRLRRAAGARLGGGAARSEFSFRRR